MLLQLNWHHNSMQNVLLIDTKWQGFNVYKAKGKDSFVLFLFHIYSFAQFLWSLLHESENCLVCCVFFLASLYSGGAVVG